MTTPQLSTQREPRPNGDGLVLVLDNGGRVIPSAALASTLPPGTLWVLNDAATLPAAFWVQREPNKPRGYPPGRIANAGAQQTFELRIAQLSHPAAQSAHPAVVGLTAIALGAGSFRDPTEARGDVPALKPGEELRFMVANDYRAVTFGRGTSEPPSGALSASGPLSAGETQRALKLPRLRVTRQRGRLLDLEFLGTYAELLKTLFALGKPIQYSYSSRAYQLHEVQNAYAGRPWAIEPASAGRQLSVQTLLALRAAGHELAWLTHAAGISSTGDAALDAQLPFPEGYDIPERTAVAVEAARRDGRLVIAVGSSTTRALESACCAGTGRLLQPLRLARGRGTASQRLGPDSTLRVVDGLLTGVHEAGSSHRELTRAFASAPSLDTAWQRAGDAGLLLHEFGDAMLILAPHHGLGAEWGRRPSVAPRAACAA